MLGDLLVITRGLPRGSDHVSMIGGFNLISPAIICESCHSEAGRHKGSLVPWPVDAAARGGGGGPALVEKGRKRAEQGVQSIGCRPV